MNAPSPTGLVPRGFSKWWISLTIFLGTLSVALSVTSVNIAIPSIMSSLSASLTQIQWVLTGFMITHTVLIPSVGWLGDRMGDRNLFIFSTAVFTAGSFLCAVSWDADSLILFRIIQAIGVGPLMGVAMAIMFEAFPPKERGLAMGLFMTSWSLGPFFGPLVGGYLTEHVNWRAIFYINIPIGLLSIASAYLFLPRTKRKKDKTPLDLAGFVTMTAAAVTLLLAISLGQTEGWESLLIVVLFAVSLVLWALFVFVELKATTPFLELRYFRSLNFSLSNLIMFFRVFGFRASNFLISLFLQNGLNYSPMRAGIFLLPGALITGIVSPAAGTLSDRVGPRIPMMLGFAIVTYALYSLSTLTLWTSMASIFFFLSLQSFGQSSLNAPLNAVALSSLPEGKARMGSGMIGLTRDLGGAFGVAILSFVLERHVYLNVGVMGSLRDNGLSTAARTEAIFGLRHLLIQSGEHGRALETKAQSLLDHTLLNEALTHAYQELFFVIMGIYMIMTVCVLFLQPKAANAGAAKKSSDQTKTI